MNKIAPKTLFTGKIIKYLPTCHSTNDVALEMIQNGDIFEGTVVVTDKQTAGRGQRGNSWEAQSGMNLTFSLILKPDFLKASEQFQLNIAISLGVSDFLNEFIDEGLKIKWSNDLYCYNQKIGGMLFENSLQGYNIGYSIIGIGLNINQMSFDSQTATSLKNITGNPLPYELPSLLEKLLEAIEKKYLLLRNGGIDSLKQQYISKLFRYQEWHYFRKDGIEFLGQILGIDEQGKLAVEAEGRIQYFGFKEIQFVI
ncbi:BirA family transcriptional regulator, biotin operon repressor / biotin-[acetyl-CoA-carboxylase] ligase [Pseudarcicella hirudinis]|uniref:BirA family transcriptional regulator, biotin operon repressor / biotin-[acetyl-CoA-carboxylase] ligase n=2 Tax=Pseudarcicella hirudinis TaxID=1079859 RepID=A0A1I5YZK0_9BACT|nr:biotin--[acetyl-CoA-carboxylase] ligase [Pseudarcicella hirudinis]SFQ49632.1 BirA family transcriptional regulator, biotin operon repressor / biotin-[acetyl-CoA-carboxylase] ligase [Pseudarcicella hirudinis]